MQPKKSLGQNFLRDEKVLEKIIKAADLKATDFVLEVGPGEGALTKELIKYAKKVIAIEKDNNLALRLDSRLRGNDKIKIISGDILEINLPDLLRHSERGGAKSKNLLKNTTGYATKKILRLRPSTDSAQNDALNYKVVANIPYYITSPIIRLFLETAYPPQVMILMVQREVAERICASSGQHSILSISVQYYAQPEILFNVNKESFWPVPEVDSAVIKIIPNKKNIPQEDVKKFFRIVRAGFSAKRKTLANNLATGLQIDKKIVEQLLKTVGFLPTVRAQELGVADWKKLVALLSN